MNPSENTRSQPGARESNCAGWNQSHREQESKGYEDRRNCAACFANDKKLEDWHDDFKGVAVVEGFHDGQKCWIGVRKRRTKDGREYLTVSLRPFQPRRQ